MAGNASAGPPARNRAEVKSGLEKSLKSYAIAAGAAGVGLLALSQAAEAKIVFTPTHQKIMDSGSLKIDLNGDGVNDFTIVGQFHTSFARAGNTGGPFPSDGYVIVQPGQASNQVLFATSVGGSKAAQALAQGATIGPGAKFGAYESMAYCSGTGGVVLGKRGPWFHETNRFLGLQFVVNGQTHYGWARLTVRLTGTQVEGCQFETVLSGYAYETVANRSILAGKTSGPIGKANAKNWESETPLDASLGLLAQGSHGSAVWRREEATVQER